MILRKLSILLILTLSTVSFGQNLYGLSASYINQSGNFGKIGLFYAFGIGDTLLTPKIDANVNMAYMRDRFQAIPEIGIIGYITSSSAYFFPYIESEFTPYTITPKVGLTFLTILDIGIGYGFNIKEKDNFKPIKGFHFSTGINIPFNWY